MEIICERGLGPIAALDINLFRPRFAFEEGDLFISEVIGDYLRV
jgi:hypothetical protein